MWRGVSVCGADSTRLQPWSTAAYFVDTIPQYRRNYRFHPDQTRRIREFLSRSSQPQKYRACATYISLVD
jgi:hypothetical protein